VISNDPITADITKDEDEDYLEDFDDWGSLIFRGGEIGGPGAQVPPGKTRGRILGVGVDEHRDLSYDFARQHRLIDVEKYEEAEKARRRSP
jgi:hypothetical protein